MSDDNQTDSRKLVWVVDDDETVLLLAEEVLASEGFRAQTFLNGQSALEAALENLPDVVVLDVLLPGLNGFEFCARLRGLPGGEDIPVLVMTSLDDPDSINRAYEAGATDFATKPINWSLETRRLRYLLRTAELAKELKQKEHETRLIKEDWERTFDSISDIVTVLDLDLRVLRANRATIKALGKPIENIVGAHCYQLFERANEPCPGCPVVRALQTGVSTSVEKFYEQPEGDHLVSASPVTDSRGGILHIVHVARDLSEQKRLETEYRQAQKMEAIGTLAGGIAHEFNNLLQVIIGFGELLGVEGVPAGGLDWKARGIMEAAGRGSALTRQLLTFSRKGARKIEKRPVDLNLLIQDVSTMLERVIARNVGVRTQLAPDLSLISGDPGQLQHVLMNLALNAAQAMSAGGNLTLRTRNTRLGPEHCHLRQGIEPGDYILLEVSDTGHGIDKRTLEHIFEPFFTTKGVGEGTGLGLSVVFGIVKEHQGDIQCASEPGRGTTFTICLPALPTAARLAPPDAEEESTASPGTETILVVDDEPGIRNLLKQHLTRSGYSVIPAPNAEIALREYKEQPGRPRLVILDLGMPGMDGWECLVKLREMDPQAKVLLATGYARNDFITRAHELGAAGVVFKPYKLGDLTKKVRAILDGSK